MHDRDESQPDTEFTDDEGRETLFEREPVAIPTEETLTKQGVEIAVVPLFTGGCGFLNYTTYIGFENTLYAITADGVCEVAPVDEGCEHILHVDDNTEINVHFVADRSKLNTIANTNDPHVKKETRQVGTKTSNGDGEGGQQLGFAGGSRGHQRYSGAGRTGVARTYHRNLHGEEAEVGGHYDDIKPPILDDII